MNYISILENLIRPLLVHQDDLRIMEFPSDNDAALFQVMVNQDDLGRIIGRQGSVANAIRTIAYAASSVEGTRLKINFDKYE